MITKYIEFIKENKSYSSIPTYEECLEICSSTDSPFYETKTKVDDYFISIFNYRLAQWSNFNMPLSEKPHLKGHELRGLTFVFNKDGSIYNRFVLLEKFFNLNQVPDSMYSVVKDYKIKFINNKEDGSIATFIKLPNNRVVGKSKMGFDNTQADAINRIYKNNADIKSFVDWCLDNDIVPIFEYVSPSNRIVLRYLEDELILLRLRDNITGKHIDIRQHIDKLNSIKIAPFEDDVNCLDDLIELVATQVDKEGSVVTCEDENGKDFFFKIKTPFYLSRHGLLTNDLYRENVIIKYILDDEIDDVLAQVPEDEKEAHERINKIIKIVRNSISSKTNEIKKAYKSYISSNMTRKEYAINHRVGNPNFDSVMGILKADDMKKMTEDEIIDSYETIENYERILNNYQPYEMAKRWLYEQTKKLEIARDWLKIADPSLFFHDKPENNNDEE